MTGTELTQLIFNVTIFAAPVKPTFAAALFVFGIETISALEKKSLTKLARVRWRSIAAAPEIFAAENKGRNTPFQ